MENRNFADRYKVNCSPSHMTKFTNEEGPWSEDEKSIAAGLALGQEKERLLNWVRQRMRLLTWRQQQAITLYYFKDLTFAEIGMLAGCSPSTACRSAKRGVARLREVAMKEGVGWSVDS